MQRVCIAATKDHGGWNNLQPIVEALRADGVTVHMVVPAKSVAGDAIARSGGEVFTSDDPAEVISRFGHPDFFITSKDSDGGIGRDLVPHMRARGAPTFVAEDFWATRLNTDWSDCAYRPDYLLINDVFGKQLVRNCWPDFPESRILITGYASLDRWMNINPAVEEQKVRQTLGLEPGIPIILFAGQGYGTAATLREVIAVLNKLGIDCYFIPRLHSRMLFGEPFTEEIPHCLAAIESFTGGRLVKDSDACSMDSLIAACASRMGSAVVSMFSTTIAIDAPAIRAPAISVFYPEIGEKSYWDEFLFTEFVPEDLGTVAVARNNDELTVIMQNALQGTLNLRPAQERHFKIDGRNARRNVEAIYSVL